jgi:PLP dependent protein
VVGPEESAESRRAELAANLTEVHERIRRAAVAAQRVPEDVTLVVITKTWPASDIRQLAELGIRHVGENRDQEAAPKQAELADLDLTWHFVGQLQTNKARSVVAYADLVESVDRPKLVAALDTAAASVGRRLDVLAQVVLDDRPGRGGVSTASVEDLVAAIAAANSLVLRGLMAVAPLGADPLPAFRRLRAVSEQVKAAHPSASVISAGMSGDLEQAIACGATHVRVGSAVLGHRPPVG